MIKTWRWGDKGTGRQGDTGKRRLRCGTGHRTYAKCGAVMVHQRERLWLLRAGINRNGDKVTRRQGEERPRDREKRDGRDN